MILTENLLLTPETQVTLPNLDNALIRADEGLLQQLLGTAAMRLLRAVRPEVTFTELREALKAMRPAWELLRDDSTRELLLELYNAQELETIAQQIGCESASVASIARSTSGRSKQFKQLAQLLGVNRPQSMGEVVTRQPRQSCRPSRGMFDHQRDAALRTQSKLLRYPHRVLLHMPTGAGKTRTAMHIIADHLRQRRNATVYWLATSEELCEQAVEEFLKLWDAVGSHEVEVVRAWGALPSSRDALCEGNSKLVVAGLAKLHSATARDPALLAYLAVKATLVVFDEAHQAVAPTYKAIVDGLIARSPNTQLLGLSATPGRTWNDTTADMILAKYFNESKVTLHAPGYDSPIKYLIDHGFLARPRFVRLVTPENFALTRQEIERLAAEMDVPESVRSRLASSDVRNVQIVRCCERLLRTHKRILLFAATVAHSDLIATVLRMNGHQAHSITGNTPGAERGRLLNWFRSSDDSPRILTNFGVLTTGFDAPRTSAVVIARPTTSLVLYSQMVGRGLRGTRAGGNHEAEIVTVIDPSIPGFGDVTEAFENWEDVWRESGAPNEP